MALSAEYLPRPSTTPLKLSLVFRRERSVPSRSFEVSRAIKTRVLSRARFLFASHSRAALFRLSISLFWGDQRSVQRQSQGCEWILNGVQKPRKQIRQWLTS